MSVDRRFREGLDRNAEVPEAPLDMLLTSVVNRAKRRRRIRRAAWSGAVAFGVVAALVLGPRVIDFLREFAPPVPAGPIPTSPPALHLHTDGHLAGRPVLPGTYRTRMDPQATFTLGSGWIGFVDKRAWLDLGFGTLDRFADFIIIRLSRIEAVNGPDAGSLVPTPDDLAAWVADHPGLSVVSPVHAVTVSGLRADQVDVLAGDQNVHFGPIPGSGGHGVPAGIGANRMVRVISVVVRGRPLLIMFGDTPAAFPTTVGRFQAVLGTLSFT